MNRQNKQTARRVAVEVLNKLDIQRADSQQLLHAHLGRTDEKAHATDLVYGTIRNRDCIDMVIGRIGALRLERVQKKMLSILRVGVYELIYCAPTPEYAIVNEASNIAGAMGGNKQVGFVNAVVRNIIRSIDKREISLVEADMRKTIPVSSMAGCQFKDDILPRPEDQPGEYLSAGFSIPLWLTREWVDQFGYEKARDICFGSNRKPGIYLCANILKTSAAELAEKLTANGVGAVVGEKEDAMPVMIKIETHQPVFSLDGFDEGYFTVQDPTAAKVGYALAPQGGQRVVDLCAAPGGKTVLLSQLMNDRGEIIATDIDSERLEKVDQNCRRLGISNVRIVAFEQLGCVLDECGGADAVLVDVPCSNTGVLARRCEVRLRITKELPGKLGKTQLKLLEKASAMVKEGGKICYSTCSISKQENKSVVERFLSTHPGFKLASEQLTLPFSPPADESCFDHDGGYVAIITKNSC